MALTHVLTVVRANTPQPQALVALLYAFCALMEKQRLLPELRLVMFAQLVIKVTLLRLHAVLVSLTNISHRAVTSVVVVVEVIHAVVVGHLEVVVVQDMAQQITFVLYAVALTNYLPAIMPVNPARLTLQGVVDQIWALVMLGTGL